MSELPPHSTDAVVMHGTFLSKISVRRVAVVAIVLVPVIYLCWAYYERTRAIRDFIHEVCADKAVAKTDMFAGFAAQRECLDQFASTPYTLATQSHEQVVSKLVNICTNTPGAISAADRMQQNLDQLGGRAPKSDRAICMEKIKAPL